MLEVQGNFDAIKANGAVTYNEQTLTTSGVSSYYYDMMNISLLQNMGFDGGTRKCAVIDTGCDINHPLLKGKVAAVRNFTTEGGLEDVTDYNGHGTHVSGLICADANGQFEGGIAKGTRLVICKVLDKRGQGGYDAITNAINFAIANKVDVINMSLGGSSNVPEMYQAVKRAYDAGIVICCASGNDARGDRGMIDQFSYPGAYQEVVEIGAINRLKQPSFFSNSNNLVDCVCYGEGILSIFPSDRYAVLDGTSQATPLVSGTILLLKEWYRKEFGRDANKDEIYGVLAKCTRNIEGISRKQIGLGYIDVSDLLD